jgi:N-acetylneuraminic acid mutarotase
MVESTPGIALLEPRAQHTATLLSDGKVLLVGGSISPSEQTADAEIYDPSTGLITMVAPLHTPRHAHSATWLPDGRVLVVSGYNQSQGWLYDAEVYDPSTDEWTVIPMLTSHGVEHTATLMNDGRVLIVGGANGSGQQSAQAEIFDPQTNSWSDVMPLASDRASHTATLLDDGRIIIIGGGSAAGIPSGGDALLYDPQLDTWTATGPMVMPRVSGESVRLPDGRVLVVGGINLQDTLGTGSNQIPLSSAEIYDPVTNAWSATDDLVEARDGHALVSLQDGQVLAIGGARVGDCCFTENSFVREIEVYEPSTGHWHIAGVLLQPGIYSAAVQLTNDNVLVTGGEAGESGMNFLTNTWLIYHIYNQP